MDFPPLSGVEHSIELAALFMWFGKSKINLFEIDDALLEDFLLKIPLPVSGIRLTAEEVNIAMADWCMEVMHKELKQDICGVGLPGTPTNDFRPTPTVEFMSLELACVNWADRMKRGNINLMAGDTYHRFFRESFLHWLELMYLTSNGGKVDQIISLYQQTLLWIFQQHPLQVYCAGLLFISPRNELKQHFRDQLHPWIKGARIAQAKVRGPLHKFDHVNDLAFTHNGTQIASASQLLAARTWDVATRSPLYKFGHFENELDVSAVAISPDGTLFAAGVASYPNCTMQIWNLRTRRLLYTNPYHRERFVSVCFSTDSTKLAFACLDGFVRLWDFAGTQKMTTPSRLFMGVNSIAFSPDGSSVAMGSSDRQITVWDVSSGLVTVLEGHLGSINSVAFSPDGNLLVAGSDDMTVKLCNVSTPSPELKSLPGHTDKVMAVNFSEDGSRIVSGSEDKTAKVWDTASGNLLYTYDDHTTGINTVRLSPDGKLLATGSFNAEIRLFDAETRSLLGVLKDLKVDGGDTGADGMVDVESEGHSSKVNSVAFSPDGHLLASGSSDHRVKIWTNEGRELHELQGHSSIVTSVVFSPDNQTVASTSWDTTVKLWNSSSGELLHTLEGHSEGVDFAKFSKDGQLVVSCSGGKKMRVWNTMAGGPALYQFEDHYSRFNDMIFAPDGKTIASCSEDLTIYLWDLKSNVASKTLSDHSDPAQAASISSVVQQLDSCSLDATIRLNARVIVGGQHPFSSVAFSLDGKWLVSLTTRGEITRLDPKTGSAHDFAKLPTGVRGITFSSDGQYLHTDRGTIDVDEMFSSSSDPEIRRPSLSIDSRFRDYHWLYRGADEAVWIPEEYHTTKVAFNGDMVAMGHTSGQISFIPVVSS